MSAFVEFQNTIIQTLSAHLHLGHAEMPQPANFIGRDFIGACFNDKPNVTMLSRFIDGLSLFQFSLTRPLDTLSHWERGWGEGIHRVKAAFDKPFLVIAPI